MIRSASVKGKCLALRKSRFTVIQHSMERLFSLKDSSRYSAHIWPRNSPTILNISLS